MKVIFVDWVFSYCELAHAHMPVIPRQGEYIHLNLSISSGLPDSAHALLALFCVRRVDYEVKNTLKVEEWMQPYSYDVNEVGTAIVHVESASNDAAKYVRRVVKKRERERQARR